VGDVERRKSFVNLMSGEQEQVTDFINTRKIKVRQKNEAELVEIASYWDSIDGASASDKANSISILNKCMLLPFEAQVGSQHITGNFENTPFSNLSRR